MSSSTPVGYLYTPQQLAGSHRYSSGIRLGNWREDDEIDEKRMMDYIKAKGNGELTLMKKQQTLGPQLAPAKLSPAPEDGVLRFGDTVMLKASMNDGALSVSLGQKLVGGDEEDKFGVFAGPSTASVARNVITFVSYDGIPAGEPVFYGQKLYLEFHALEEPGYLASSRTHGPPVATQLIAKQEVWMQNRPTHNDCAWVVYPESVDDRIPANGTPVAAGAPIVLSHCFTNKRLAAVNVGLPTDFGVECGVCAHTFTETGKVNKLMRETMGRPTSNLISRSETTENQWTLIYE
mmetsp:Transcript_40051/g.105897  ORF Transcript_40051/g.105897 Transcript_40051/m.105897 type:complete len:292 (-) Transcript_40051:396-1271(-)